MGLDLTGKTDSAGHSHPILALVDHNTRANLRLIALLDKRSATVLKVITKTIVRFGHPKFIRTDNEASFSSRLFNAGLKVFGIGH